MSTVCLVDVPSFIPELTKNFQGETCSLEQVAERGCECPSPGDIQGQAGCGSRQPGLVVDDPAHSKGVEIK